MSGQAQMWEMGPPLSLRFEGSAWGIDPSTKRISLATIQPLYGFPPILETVTVSLEAGGEPRRLASCRRGFARLVGERDLPDLVAIEQPMGRTAAQVHPSSHHVIGVLLEALGARLGDRAPVVLVPPQSWKAVALGKGHGHASKPEIMEWARAACGYKGSLEDEADALGIATWAAVRLSLSTNRRG